MSNTYKHKGQGLFKNTDTSLEKIHKSTQRMWDRHNSDFGEDKERQLQIKERIAEKELKQQIKTDEYNFKPNGEHIEDDSSKMP
jgi:hypothetical protein